MSTTPQSTPEVNIIPKRIRARKGKYQVNVHNQEARTNTYQLKATDEQGMCVYTFDTDTITVEPGATLNVKLTVSFKTIYLMGKTKICNFNVTATTTTGEVKSSEGQLECPSLIPVWALAAGALLVVAIVVVVITLADGGEGDSAALNNNTSATTNLTTSTVTTKPLASTTTTMASTSGTQPVANNTTPSTSQSTTLATTTTIATTAAMNTPALTTQTTSATPNLNGVWTFSITVTEAYGACAGEAGGPADSRQITITQAGQNITLAGFLGSPVNKLTGTIALENGIWVINVSGSYAEDGGTTTSSHRLEVKNNTEITGVEDWSWSGGGGTCPGGKASVTAKKVSG